MCGPLASAVLRNLRWCKFLGSPTVRGGEGANITAYRQLCQGAAAKTQRKLAWQFLQRAVPMESVDGPRAGHAQAKRKEFARAPS